MVVNIHSCPPSALASNVIKACNSMALVTPAFTSQVPDCYIKIFSTLHSKCLHNHVPNPCQKHERQGTSIPVMDRALNIVVMHIMHCARYMHKPSMPYTPVSCTIKPNCSGLRTTALYSLCHVLTNGKLCVANGTRSLLRR